MGIQLLDHRGDPIVRESVAPAGKTRTLGELKRFAAQYQNRIHGTYDAARSNPDMDKYWANSDTFDADSAHSPAVRGQLVRRSRYEVANNGYSDGIAQTYATDLVGAGPQLRMLTKNKNFKSLVETSFFNWTEAVCFRRKLWTMAHAKHVDGESLAIMRINPKIDDPVKLDLALHETEQCATPFKPYGDPSYIDGIKLDQYDDPLWYDFLTNHPGDTAAMPDLKPHRVPANRVLHWFKLRRPGQHRGVPECASTLNLGASFRRLREANLATAEKVAAWTLFMKSLAEPDEDDDAFTVPMDTFEIVHGMLTALPNGQEPLQLKAEHPGPTYDIFHDKLLNEQARPKNMPLNKAGCNSAKYNYASGRLDHQTYYGSLDGDRLDCNDCVTNPLFKVWWPLAVKAYGWFNGRVEQIGPAARAHVWAWPKHRVADVESEANASQTRLSSGQIFIDQFFAENGDDFEDAILSAAAAYGVEVDELRQRVLDVLLPPPKTAPPAGGDGSIDEPAVAAVMRRALNRLNSTGAHHAN
jgi:capsid protein